MSLFVKYIIYTTLYIVLFFVACAGVFFIKLIFTDIRNGHKPHILKYILLSLQKQLSFAMCRGYYNIKDKCVLITPNLAVAIVSNILLFCRFQFYGHPSLNEYLFF